MRITTNTDLEKLKTAGQKLLRPETTRIMVGTATCCRAKGADQVLKALEREAGARKFACTIVPVGCIGLCHREPTIEVIQPGKPRIAYGPVFAEDVPDFISALAGSGVDKKRALFRTDQEYALFDAEPRRYAGSSFPEELREIPEYREFPFYKKQQKICLRNAGTINPESIDEYIAVGGCGALVKALTPTAPFFEKEEVLRTTSVRAPGSATYAVGRLQRRWPPVNYNSIHPKKFSFIPHKELRGFSRIQQLVQRNPGFS